MAHGFERARPGVHRAHHPGDRPHRPAVTPEIAPFEQHLERDALFVDSTDLHPHFALGLGNVGETDVRGRPPLSRAAVDPVV